MTIFDENNHRSSTFRDTSFIGRLHEEGVIDAEEYLKLEDWLWENFRLNDQKVSKEIIIRFGIMNTFLLRSIVYHQNESDGYKIKNASMEDLYNLMERMNQVLEGLSDSELPRRECLPKVFNA
jgi:hypothetical protein